MVTQNRSSLVWHSQHQDNPILNDWLFNQDSLTRRLIWLSQDHFSIRVVNEGWQILRNDEYSVLQASQQEEGWVREVFLCGHNTPWVYARSVATKSSLERAGFNMAELGSRSLGELLFSNHAFSRGAIEICSLDPSVLPSAVLPYTLAHDSLWARRSCFSHDRLNILVAEAFLPAFWEYA